MEHTPTPFPSGSVGGQPSTGVSTHPVCIYSQCKCTILRFKLNNKHFELHTGIFTHGHIQPTVVDNVTSRRYIIMMTSSNRNILCVTSPLCGEFTGHRWIPLTKASDGSFDVCFFALQLNKRLCKQSWGWWFETWSRPLWRHCNDCALCFAWYCSIASIACGITSLASTVHCKMHHTIKYTENTSPVHPSIRSIYILVKQFKHSAKWRRGVQCFSSLTNYVREWPGGPVLVENPPLRTYSKINSNLQPRAFLYPIKIRKHRIALFRLCTNSHAQEIGRGRLDCRSKPLILYYFPNVQ